MADQLLILQVVTGVPDKLRVKHQAAKLNYDQSAKDLPEMNVGQPIRIKPLPGDRTGRWRRGVCLQQLGLRSYLVDIDGATYRRNRIDLRPAEAAPPQLSVHPELAPEQPARGGSAGEIVSAREVASGPEESPRSPQTGDTPCRELQSRAFSRSGRLIRPPDRLDL